MQFTILSFPRKRESRRPAVGWMPAHVRHDESGTARLQPNVKRSRCGLRLLACHCVLLWSLFLTGCQWLDGSAQTGHRDIAASIRRVLDAAYAGADHTRYSADLRALEAVTEARLAAVPSHLKPRIAQMLTNLRTAREVLGWQAERSAPRPAEVEGWIARHPFLQAAVGATADAPDAFDIHTALHLLWDQTNEILRDVQVKNRPI